MSLEYQWPSSSGLEIEARRLHATPRPEARDETDIALALRRFPQAFETAAFAATAFLVFPKVFFAGLSPLVAMAASLALLGLGPLVGALPSPVFGLVERRHGRGVRVTAARVMLGSATAAIAFIPGAAQLGSAAVLMLVGCRLAQAVAMSGLTQDCELAQPRSLIAPSELAGGAFAALLMAGLFLATSRADFLAWGWRYPFIVAIACNIVGLFADLRLLATPRAATRSAPPRLVASGGKLI